MTMDQYSAFIELLPQIEKELVKKGERVGRPQYDGQVNKEEEVVGDEDSVAEKTNLVLRKSNIEATSDEEED